MPYVLVALLMLILSGPANAQVHVDIGFHLPAPPKLVIVPGHASVHYAPAAPANFFSYGGQYWVFADGGWHVSGRHSGPWIQVAPQFVPRPLLFVPVRYYHVPPGHWKQWNHQVAPHWDQEWGHEWAHKRQWKGQGRHVHHRGDRDDDHGRRHGKDHDKDHGKDHGRGHGKDHGRGR